MKQIRFDPFWENDWPIKVGSERTRPKAEAQSEYVVPLTPAGFPKVEVRFDPFWQNDWPISSAIRAKAPKSRLVEESIEERAHKFIIHTQIAEFYKEEIQVSVDNRYLRVSCEHKTNKPERRKENGKPSLYSLCEEFLLPEAVDNSNLRIDVHDGWLRVEIPKRATMNVSAN
jgi:HSP20 family molecular chaperone IbpA